MYFNSPRQGLALANELVVEGCSTFTFGEVEKRLGKLKTATANLLKRMEKDGLVDRVRRGHYAVRQLGVLGMPTATQDIALSVGAALQGVPHRIAYRSALYEHDLLLHPVRSIQVAVERRTRTKTLSGWPLQVVVESPENLEVGRVPWGISYISDPRIVPSWMPHSVRGLSVPRGAGLRFLLRTRKLAAQAILINIRTIEFSRSGHFEQCVRLGSLADAL